MKTYLLRKEQFIQSDLTTIWDFFSTPDNLDLLTPDDMGFDILSEQPIPKMHLNQIIEYKVRPILNIPLYWKTEITEVVNEKSFTDEQRKGPYSLWRHKHIFEEREGGVYMIDELTYALPLGPLGQIAHTLFVKNQLKDIFDYRYDQVEKIFNQSK